MYHQINGYIQTLLKSIDRKKDIDPYLLLLRMFDEGSVVNNERFKSTYRKYWQLNAARVSDSYCKHYFQVMENHRYSGNKSIKDVVSVLYNVPSNLKGIKTIQFSFATKLLHTIDNTLPMYDSLVADFYFCPQIKPYWKYAKKLSTYLQIYDFLLREQKRILDNHFLSESIGKVRGHFKLPREYTDQKIIDTLLWKFAADLRAGAIIRGDLEYS
jgi:hypothetical protein